MLGKKVGAGVLAGVATLALSVPAPASAAVTFGGDLSAPPDGSALCADAEGCTAASSTADPEDLAPGGLTAPSAGVLVRWRVRMLEDMMNGAVEGARLRVLDGNTGVSASGPVTIADLTGVQEFPTRLAVAAGERLGIDVPFGGQLPLLAGSPSEVIAWVPPLADRETRPPDDVSAGYSLALNADLEPDADADGFGDETQDGCPDNQLRQDDCIPPETTITKEAPNRTAKTKVKFKFESDEPDSSFQCKLDGGKFKRCESPKTVKHLDDGKHKFKVRAKDTAGNVDPSPDKDKFKVVD